MEPLCKLEKALQQLGIYGCGYCGLELSTLYSI